MSNTTRAAPKMTRYGRRVDGWHSTVRGVQWKTQRSLRRPYIEKVVDSTGMTYYRRFTVQINRLRWLIQGAIAYHCGRPRR